MNPLNKSLSEAIEWNPELYLQEYFPPQIDEEPTLKFISEEGRRLSNQPLAIDVGCGPTVCYASALAPYVSGFHLADYSEANLEYLRRWVEGGPGSFDWRNYTRFSLGYEGHPNPSDAEIFRRENLFRSKIVGYLFCDVTLSDPLGPAHRGQYQGVMSLFCADSVASNKVEWRIYLQNALSLLKPGGFFIGAALRNCPGYSLGPKTYPSPNVNEDDFKELLLEAGFDRQSLRIEVAPESHKISESALPQPLKKEYNEVVLVSGFLRP